MMNQRLQAPLSQWDTHTDFAARHIGPAAADEAHMLQVIGQSSRHALMQAVVPASIALQHPMDLPPAATEAEALQELKSIACRNRILKSFIGQGYYGTHTPGVIQRNILENPAWYTAYTPYQAEISQGRLEALLNFQTMVCDLTAMPIANASMLDEATAGLDPVVRGELLDLFLEFIQDERHSIVMSSHITADLEQIADSISYLHNGQLLFQENKDDLLQEYGVLHCGEDVLTSLPAGLVVFTRRGAYGCESLVRERRTVQELLPEAVCDAARLDDIMRFYSGRDAQ